MTGRLDRFIWFLPLVWGATLAFLWRNFTFFWDEWNVLSVSLEKPLTGVLEQNGGNFFPLSRILFTLEAHVFRENYWAYIFITGSLFGFVGLSLVKFVLRPRSPIERWLAIAIAATYLLSAGVLFASSMGFMLKWALAPLLALFGVALYGRLSGYWKPLFALLGFLFLSALSFSSATVIMSAFVVGAIFISASRPLRTKIAHSALIILCGGLLGGLGAIAAKMFPASDAVVSGDPLSGIDITNPLRIIADAWSASLSGILAVVGVLPLANLDLWIWLLFLVVGSAVVALALSLILAGLLVISRERVALSVVFGCALVTMAFLIVFKDPIIVRYQALWALPAILVVWLILTRSREFSWFPAARFLVGTWMTIALVIAIVSVPRAGQLERDRYLVDAQMLYSPATCLSEAGRHSEEISPSASPEYVCAVVAQLTGGTFPKSRG